MANRRLMVTLVAASMALLILGCARAALKLYDGAVLSPTEIAVLRTDNLPSHLYEINVDGRNVPTSADIQMLPGRHTISREVGQLGTDDQEEFFRVTRKHERGAVYMKGMELCAWGGTISFEADAGHTYVLSPSQAAEDLTGYRVMVWLQLDDATSSEYVASEGAGSDQNSTDLGVKVESPTLLKHNVSFTNLPDSCTIWIFSLDGSLITALKHYRVASDTGPKRSAVDWDMRNEDGDIVQYGISIFHVESSIGAQKGKFAVTR